MRLMFSGQPLKGIIPENINRICNRSPNIAGENGPPAAPRGPAKMVSPTGQPPANAEVQI